MPAVNRGEVWLIDFGMAAKIRPALLLAGNPKDDELDLITVLLHTTALRGTRGAFDSETIFEIWRISPQQSSDSSTIKLERNWEPWPLMK